MPVRNWTCKFNHTAELDDSPLDDCQAQTGAPRFRRIEGLEYPQPRIDRYPRPGVRHRNRQVRGALSGSPSLFDLRVDRHAAAAFNCLYCIDDDVAQRLAQGASLWSG